jgi:hypothetical protein
MLKFKLSTNKKHKYVVLNHTRYFVFKVGSLPKDFAEVRSELCEDPIRHWLNYKGFTLINQCYLKPEYQLR